MPFGYVKQVVFYIRYLYLKVVRLWFDVRRPKLRLFLYEMAYTACRVLRRDVAQSRIFNIDGVSTIFGDYRVRPNTMDLACASPAFERADLDELISLLKSYERQRKRFTFVDVGADFGTYSVAVGTHMVDYAMWHGLAFEPMTDSYDLLASNVIDNGLSARFTLYNCALSDDDGTAAFHYDPHSPGSSGYDVSMLGPGVLDLRARARRFDALAADLDLAETLVMKLDVEGLESKVIDGAQHTLSRREVVLLVEDFVNPDIVEHLKSCGFAFTRKLSPYNSWWYRPRPG